MTVTVRLFAGLRERIGAETIAVELSDNATPADLQSVVSAQYPAVAGLIARSAVAVNGEYAASDRPLAPTDEVALIPPVSGG
jgi:molybdopterin converting factor subunit 1